MEQLVTAGKARRAVVSLAEEMREAKMQAKGRDAGLSAQLAAETRSRATHLLMQAQKLDCSSQAATQANKAPGDSLVPDL